MLDYKYLKYLIQLVKLLSWHAFAYTNAAGSINTLMVSYCYTEDLLALEAASYYEVSLPGDCCLIKLVSGSVYYRLIQIDVMSSSSLITSGVVSISFAMF